MKKKNYLYLTDRAIYYKCNNNIIKYPINKDIIHNSKVANIKKFTKVFNTFISSNKINNSLFGDKIIVIINNTWTNADMDVLNNILMSLNYRKVLFEYESRYYKLTCKNVYLSIWNDYMLMTYLNDYNKENTILISSNIFSNLEDKMEYIAKTIGKKELYLFGFGNELQKLFNVFEDTYNINTYIFSNNETYILDNA